jgi:hypothetical protein
MVQGGTADGFFVDDVEITADVSVDITENPTGVVVCPGESAMFNVGAEGTGPLSYQWQMDTIDIVGATSDSYMLSDIVPADAGTYRAEVTNSCSEDTSGGAILTVRTLAGISQQPAPFTEVAQGAQFFLLSGGTGSSPLTLQWQLDGVDIVGATSGFIVVPTSDCDDQGIYTLTATNPCGSTTSNQAVVVVTGCDAGPTPGDCDGDGDVDLVDFGEVQLCFTGPGGTIDPGCECADFDEDGDIDLVDFGEFQLAFTGPL